MEEESVNEMRVECTRRPMSLMRGRGVVCAITIACGALALGGCETGRTNKAHAEWQKLSDETTTGKPDHHQALSPGHHQPPVPGSPTAAGADGNQPLDDMEARTRHETAHGDAAAPFAQPADSPERRPSKALAAH